MRTIIGTILSTWLVCLVVTPSSANAQTQEVKISEPAPIKVEELFKQSDLIAVVSILSGDAEHYPNAVYKAEVLQAFKGTEKGSTVYFGPFLGYGIGEELLVFLRDSGKGLEPNQKSASSGLTYGSIPSYYRVTYEGYSALHIKYECVFDGKETTQQCDSAVKVNTRQVILPKSLSAFPTSTKGAFRNDTFWVRKSVFIEYLEKLSK